MWRRRANFIAAAANGASSIPGSVGHSGCGPRRGRGCGDPQDPDFNTGDNEGSSYFQVNQKRGRRWSAARGFLKPALERPQPPARDRRARGSRDVENGRAVGIAFTKDGQPFEARAAGEVIVAAGAVNSPHLLELSGIGNAERLSALGIPALHHAPGVGENLQDHLQLRPTYKVHGVRTLDTDYSELWRRALMGLDTCS